MNPILELKGGMRPVTNKNKGGGFTFDKNFFLHVSSVGNLINSLKDVYTYWSTNRGIAKALVNVHYKRVVPKTRRISILLSEKGVSQVETVRGAKFEIAYDSTGNSYHRHVFTHYVTADAINQTLKNLENVKLILNTRFGGRIRYQDVENIKRSRMGIEGYSKTTFLKLLKDIDSVANFSYPNDTTIFEGDSIISIYNLNVDVKHLMSTFGVQIDDTRIYNQTTLRLTLGEIQRIQKNAPFLISMGVSDINNIPPINERCITQLPMLELANPYPKPNGEPIVGVIDTQFDTQVHFNEWVNFENRITDSTIPLTSEDSAHGTAVSFIIVDGPSLNPELEDGCGRFRVRHFGVATKHGFRSFEIMQEIRKIIISNRDIKVWNLSLGANAEISENFISPSAAELDALQYEFDDIIFVVAGTNDLREIRHPQMRVGSPADSLNSIVVNSVTFDNAPTSYTRVGPVLSFFRKPDVAYYGGDGIFQDNRIKVYNGGVLPVSVLGTSYAAPWISRKMAYLIHIVGLPREVAKALLLDSAAGWDTRKDTESVGYGVVPKRIEDILQSKNGEIKFFIFGRAEEYEMRNYQLPVPLQNGTFPYYARATLAYFPYCERNQGVDYTCTEMDIRLGRLEKDARNEYAVRDIKKNRQGEKNSVSNKEENARRELRKWDNIKHLCEKIPEKRPVAKGRLDSDFWGLRIITKERISDGRRHDLAYGVVVTLHEINGVNRINEFESACLANGWIVNRINAIERIQIHQKAEEEIVFE